MKVLMDIKKPLFTAIILAYYLGFVLLTDNFVIVKGEKYGLFKGSKSTTRHHDCSRHFLQFLLKLSVINSGKIFQWFLAIFLGH